MKKIDLVQMEQLEGGDWSWSGCGDALAGTAVTRVGAIALWKVALVAGAALCVAGGVGAFD